MVVYITNQAAEPGVILSEHERVEESIHPRLCIKDIGCEDPSTTHLRCFAQDDTEIRYFVRSTINSKLTRNGVLLNLANMVYIWDRNI